MPRAKRGKRQIPAWKFLSRERGIEGEDAKAWIEYNTPYIERMVSACRRKQKPSTFRVQMLVLWDVIHPTTKEGGHH